jgi:hypothetical protein
LLTAVYLCGWTNKSDSGAGVFRTEYEVAAASDALPRTEEVDVRWEEIVERNAEDE